MHTRILSALFAAALLGAGCDNVLDVNPTASIPSDEALNSPRKLAVAVTGAYDVLQADDYYGGDGILVVPDLYADDLDFTGTFTNLGAIDNGGITSDNASFLPIWQDLYDGIGRANNILAAIPNVEGLSEDEAASAEGQARFLRALHYFNLVNFFGGVPLVLTPTTSTDEVQYPARATAAEVWAQIEADLTATIDGGLLPTSGSPNFATEGAAKALLARVHLYQGEYAPAGALAGDVISNYDYTLVPNFAALFEAKNTAESIFEVEFTKTDANNLAFYYFPQALGGRYQFAPSADLIAAYDPSDARRPVTLGAVDEGTDDEVIYGTKYFRIQNSDDNVIVLRLAEMYLIRAEARARAGELTGALADLNTVRVRAGLDELAGLGQPALLDAILEERRREFALENQRFFDLRRLGLAESVLGLSANQLLFPIPQRELDVNPQLGQNEGY